MMKERIIVLTLVRMVLAGTMKTFGPPYHMYT